MQWLIDLVIEAIGIPPTFIDRGDPAVPDFTEVGLIKNDAWHDLDLSAIVPEGASAVAFHLSMFPNIVGRYAYFSKTGNVNFNNVGSQFSMIAGITYEADIIVKVDSARKIQYFIQTGFQTNLFITVKGWWL